MTDPQILIIDDSEDDVMLACSYIRRRIKGARFRRVDCSNDLKLALSETRWDLVLCDHNMPLFDSTSALRQVREFASGTPFFIYSGDFTGAQAATAIAGGASGVVEKRDATGLLRVIDAALAVRAAQPT